MTLRQFKRPRFRGLYLYTHPTGLTDGQITTSFSSAANFHLDRAVSAFLGKDPSKIFAHRTCVAEHSIEVVRESCPQANVISRRAGRRRITFRKERLGRYDFHE